MTAARESAELLEGQNRVLELIARGKALPEVLDSLLGVIQAQCPEMFCSILLLDSDGVHVRHGAARNLPEAWCRAVDGEPIGPRAGSCGTAAFRREPVIVVDIATDPLWEAYREAALSFGLRSCWSTPIFDSERRVLGTFAMYFDSPRSPEMRHLRLIEICTQIAAIAITSHQKTDALRIGEERLRLALSGGNVDIWEYELDSARLGWRGQLNTVFDWSANPKSLTLAAFTTAIHPADRENIQLVLRDPDAWDSGREFEFRVIYPDNSLHWFASKARCERGVGETAVRICGIALEITRRKEAERQLLAANSALAKELQERTRAENEIKALTARLIGAQEDERTRIARELHDDLCQELASLSIAATNLKRNIGPEAVEARAQSERIQQKLIHLSQSVRQLSHSLHPALLQYSGLAAALENYCSEFGNLTGLTIFFHAEGSFDRLATPVALCLFRIAQETLQNVRKHAQVDQARLRVTRSAESVSLTISDDGVGFDPLHTSGSQGLGLVSIKERVRLVNGTLRMESQPQKGTTLVVTVPLPAV